MLERLLPEGEERERPGDEGGGSGSGQAFGAPHSQVVNARQGGRQSHHGRNEHHRQEVERCRIT